MQSRLHPSHERIVIIGAGPVGLICALSLANLGFDVVIFEQKSIEELSVGNSRMLALSYASVEYLANLAIDVLDKSTLINQIHISHSGFAISNIYASELDLDYLGTTINYSQLNKILLAKVIASPQIKFHTCNVTKVLSSSNYATINYEANGRNYLISSDLAILAEGGSFPQGQSNSFDYAEYALIVTIHTEQNHQNKAYERFDTIGALALLPLEHNQYTLIWTIKRSNYIKEFSDPEYLTNYLMQLKFMQRFMPFKCISQITLVPLMLVKGHARVDKRIISLGNAAQKIHPISAQGLNLAIRDVKVFTQHLSINRYNITNSVLNEYHNLRQKDVNMVINFTHKLALKSKQNGKLNKLTTTLGLSGLTYLPYIKKSLVAKLIFGSLK